MAGPAKGLQELLVLVLQMLEAMVPVMLMVDIHSIKAAMALGALVPRQPLYFLGDRGPVHRSEKLSVRQGP